MNRKADITLVGAGHYARDLIAGKYRANPGAALKAFISPTTSKKTLAESGLGKIPLVRSASEWLERFGKPSKRDIFDLCVHSPVVPGLLEDLARLGAKNIVLPKPVTLCQEGLRDVLRLSKKYKLSLSVSSQWHYSKLMPDLRSLLIDLSKKHKLNKAVFDFSQTFTPEQRRHYTPSTALLPHMLQIAHSCGLCRFDGQGAMKITKQSSLKLDVLLREKNALVPEVCFKTDLLRKAKVRTLTIFADKKSDPILTADFIGLPNIGNGEGHWIAWNGLQLIAWEDNLKTMVESTLTSLNNLTLEQYTPVVRQQIRIQERL